ncbi:Non-structural maintenance of chromosomes like protein [Argiope bruennichi]|uniref:Non-structural maintenance of chromosomes like protein n=1 Tax=Argiope bruennichi TaxID=94029 RepID=A0A8T0FAQ2_ARGBR|nr:Non-structural maintenance of chromosomes like protein [Argiope bruennichi]
MNSEVRPPRTARKSRNQGNASVTLNITESESNAASSSASNTVRKSARKSTGTRKAANTNQTQGVPNAASSSLGISQDTTVPFSQPGCSRDDGNLSDYDTEPSRSLRSSLNSTVPLSRPGCSKDPDSSDSEVSPNLSRKMLRRKAPTPATKTSKKPPVVVSSSSPSSTSEESEFEELLKKQADKKLKAQAKAEETSIKKTVRSENSSVDPSNLVNQCVFYILVADRSKKAIRKRDIIHHVFDGRNTHLFPEILKKAASCLQKIFGFELMELKSNKNEYLLVNNLCHQYDVQEYAEYSRMERQIQGLTFHILTLIFMNENSIIEDELWKALEPLGIEIKSRKPHPIFGDVQKFITGTLVKQMYLVRRQLSKDPPLFELTWGERAHKEVLKEDILEEFVCKIMPDTKPEEWILQYKDAKGKFKDIDAEMEAE